jgi:hypothetical protein
MGSLFAEIVKTWRSVASVGLAYGLIALLAVYNQDWLYQAFDLSRGGYNQATDFVSHFSKLGGVLTGVALNPGSVFVTMMILFARVVVLSVLLWIGKLLGGALFGRKESSPSRL